MVAPPGAALVEAHRALLASLAGVPDSPDPKRGRFDQRLARNTRAPATTRTANPATRTQLPHHMSWLTRPTTMRIAETTASRVASGRDIARDIAWFLRS